MSTLHIQIGTVCTDELKLKGLDPRPPRVDQIEGL